jgi:hypothetical protein
MPRPVDGSNQMSNGQIKYKWIEG